MASAGSDAGKVQCPLGVKLRRTQCEQMSSGSTLKADLAQSRRHFAFGPIGDLTDNFTALFNVLT
jgi:hypothetical protein